MRKYIVRNLVLNFSLLLLALPLWSQTPQTPAQYNGNPNRTLDLRNPKAGTLQKSLEYDFDKFKNRSVSEPAVPLERSCSTKEVEEDMNIKNAGQTEDPEVFEEWMQEASKRMQKSRSLFRSGSLQTYTLPVVVHVVYSNSVENISEAQILSQMEVLNQDYRRTNPDKDFTSRDFKNIAVDTGIEFCLATVDPDGNPTNGIDRVSLSGSPFNEQTINDQVKPATIWDPNRYFNIWVLNIAEGVLGFAQFPMSSGLTGIPQLPATTLSDGVVINYFAFGTIGTVSEPFNRGRTATHEIGHWLGLRHVWGDGPCGVDDYCSDTPETLEANFGCPGSVIGCNGKVAMIQNFMEYTNDACMNLFTRDQRTRMRTVLENSPRRQSLRTSTACEAIVEAPKADFVANVQSGCGPLKVQFSDKSKGEPTRYAWTFEGGRPANSSKANPNVRFTRPGKYLVKLSVANAGGRDEISKEGYIHVRASGLDIPFAQDFESKDVLLSTDLQLHNPQNDHAWSISDRVSARGNGKASLTINNFDNNLLGSMDWVLTPILNLSTAAEPVLAFDVAYATYTGRYSDTLGVFISTGCDTRFHNIYLRGGQELATLDRPQSKPFTPREKEWRREMIDLKEYIGQSHVQVAFVNLNGHGNDLYLDDVYVGEKPPPVPIADFDISQTSLCAGDQVSFTDRSQNEPEQWIWTFDRGVPASDTTRNPVVRYPEAGFYDVKLTVRSKGGTDTKVYESVITVKPKPDLVLSASSTEVCAGQEVELAVRGKENLQLTWSLGPDIPLPTGRTVRIAPQSDALYSVTGIDSDGCTASSSLSISVKEGQTLAVTPPSSTICEGQSVRLTANGADNYTWSPAIGLNRTSGPTVQATPSQTTTYTLTGRTRTGCELKKQVTITVDAAPGLSIVADRASICPGEKAKLQGKGAASYSWSPATGLNTTEGDLVLAAPKSTTTYTLTASTVAGCEASTKKTIQVGSVPRISLTSSAAEICEDQQVQLQASGGIRYHWSPETSLSQKRGARITATPKVSTRFTVMGWNEEGCTDTTSILVGVLPKPELEIEVSSPSICRGESAELLAIAPAATSFKWRPRGSLDVSNGDRVIANPRKETTYMVEIVDAYGCRNTAETTISLNRGQRPKAAFSVSQREACLGQEVQFQSESSNAAEFLWEFPGGNPAMSREANPVVEFIELGPQDVILSVFGCDGTQDFIDARNHLTISSPFELSLNTDGGTICKGQTMELIASGADDYEWSPASGLDETSGALVVASPTASTTYTVTATDFDGCKAKREIILEVVGEGGDLQIQPFAPSICAGESVNLSVSGASSYFWRPANGLTRGVSARVTVTPTETTTYVVEGTTIDGCILMDSVEVTVRKRPQLVVSPSAPNLCPGDQIKLRLNRKGLFTWFPTEGLSTASGTVVDAFPNKTTTYTITGTDENGCKNSTSITVEVGSGSPLQVDAKEETICLGESTLLTASGGSGYQWFPADGLDKTSGPIVSARPERTTTYTVSTQGGGCGNERSVTVVVRAPKALTINPPSPIVVCEGSEITLSASGGKPRTYVWDEAPEITTFAKAEVTIRPTITKSYKVRALDENNCEMLGFVTVEVAAANFLEASISRSRICKDNSISLEAKGADTYEWLPGDGIVVRSSARTSARPTQSGLYRVVGRNEAGCRDTAQVQVEVSTLEAAFKSSTDQIDLARSPGAVRFTDLTIGATSWKWDFGNGSSSTEQNPLHIFREPGTYQVKLEAGDGICTSTHFIPLTITNSSDLTELAGDGTIRVTEQTTDGIIDVEMDLPRDMTLTMFLTDNSDKQIATGQLRLKAGPYRQRLSLASPGIYRFKLRDANNKEREWRIVYGG